MSYLFFIHLVLLKYLLALFSMAFINFAAVFEHYNDRLCSAEHL